MKFPKIYEYVKNVPGAKVLLANILAYWDLWNTMKSFQVETWGIFFPFS